MFLQEDRKSWWCFERRTYLVVFFQGDSKSWWCFVRRTVRAGGVGKRTERAGGVLEGGQK